MRILSPGIFPQGGYPQMVEDAAYFHHHRHQPQLNSSSSSLDDEFDLFQPHFPSEPCSNSLRSYPVPLNSAETMPGFTTRSVGTPQVFTQKPRKWHRAQNWNSPPSPEHETMTRNVVTSSPSPDSRLISFRNPDSASVISSPFYDCEEPKMKNASMIRRTPLHAQEHMLAERKRREKINECFVMLSAVISNHKKMDKASILEGAIKYLKELQERIKALEEEVAAKTLQSVTVVKKSLLGTDDDTYSLSDRHTCRQIDQQLSLLEIEARVYENCVLIKILCEKRNGFTLKMIGEIEKLNLTVENSCVMPFGSSILDVTILAQMNVEYSMKMGDLVRNLRGALLDSM